MQGKRALYLGAAAARFGTPSYVYCTDLAGERQVVARVVPERRQVTEQAEQYQPPQQQAPPAKRWPRGTWREGVNRMQGLGRHESACCAEHPHCSGAPMTA